MTNDSQAPSWAMEAAERIFGSDIMECRSRQSTVREMAEIIMAHCPASSEPRVATLEDALLACNAELGKLREALEQYADPENWFIDNDNKLLIWNPDQIDRFGEREGSSGTWIAKQALAQAALALGGEAGSTERGAK